MGKLIENILINVFALSYFEEYEYMMDIADRLLKYQIQTATDEEEINYLKRLNLL